MKNTLIMAALLCLSAAGAALFLERTGPTTFEQEIVRADLEEAEPQVRAAYLQYPEAARRVFDLFGQTPEFQDVLHRYGHNQIVPIADACLQGGDGFLEAGSAFDQVVGALSQFRWPTVQKLTPQECAWRAILLTRVAGNDFLGQFAIDNNGQAHRLPGSTVLITAKDVVVGGAQNLERKLVLGEETSWRDWAGAALDVAVLGVGAKSVAVVARAQLAKDVAKPTISARLVTAREGMLAFAKTSAPRIAKYATVGGVGYLTVFHPNVISGALRTIAEIVGIDPLLLQIAGWTAILFLPLMLFGSLFRFLRLAWRLISAPVRIGRWLARLAPRRLAHAPETVEPAEAAA